MIPYASQTSGPNRRLIEGAGWGQFVSPDTRAKNGLPTTRYALDNGAWGAFNNGRPWDQGAFLRLFDELAPRADFVVVPDVVTNASATLALAREWLPRLEGAPRYLAIQDGMTWADVDALPPCDGVALGGSTAWKWTHIETWCRGARDRGLPVHVLRVNSVRRIRICWNAGVSSFDGSGVSRYGRVKMPLLQSELLDCARNEVRQQWLLEGTEEP